MNPYTILSPHCQQVGPVLKYGSADAGTLRAKCKTCKRFVIGPKFRAVTADKKAAILRHLEERTSIRGICRALRCTSDTVYTAPKKVEALSAFEQRDVAGRSQQLPA
jgi:transposase-like protein